MRGAYSLAFGHGSHADDDELVAAPTSDEVAGATGAENGVGATG